MADFMDQRIASVEFIGMGTSKAIKVITEKGEAHEIWSFETDKADHHKNPEVTIGMIISDARDYYRDKESK